MSEADHDAGARAVYDATAEVYAASVGTAVSAAFEAPLDRALLVAFAEEATAATPATRPIVDIGCGTGRVTAHLASLGLDVIGVDPSTAMLAVAWRAHPALPFESGRLTSLPFDNGSLGGAVSWYSIIHTPAEALDAAFAEMARVVVGEGTLLVAFQAGAGEAVHRDDAYGTGLPLTHYRHGVADVAARLRTTGWTVRAEICRQPVLAHETTPQGFIFATRR